MKKWMIYVLGVMTGIILTYAFGLISYKNMGNIIGLEMFEEPGDYMEYSEFEVIQVVESGCALACADNSFSTIVFIIPNEGQHFYDDQEIVLKNNQCAQHVGTYKYSTKMETEKTVPAIRIVDGVELPKSNKTEKTVPAISKSNKTGITLFEKPGGCVSRKDFEIQEVLDSGDAIALEIKASYNGTVLTSDLEVLILAQEGSNFYDKQIVKAPSGKCARQIGNYKYQDYGRTKVIPIITFN